MPDEIARLSDALARDPGGLDWVPLAEALRRARQLDAAERTALRGLERHPYHVGGHDVLARIAADAGDLGRARDEWEMALRLDPHHIAAMLGLGWLALTGGDHVAARQWWARAHDIAPDDARVAAVGRQLQLMAPSPVPASRDAAPAGARYAADAAPGATHVPALEASQTLFSGVLQHGATFVLLVDADGLVLAGEARGADGHDCSDALAAELSGVSGEAARALTQLQLGAWERLLVECEQRTLAVAPGHDEAVTLVATAASGPSGLPRLLVDRARRLSDAWLAAL